MIQIHAKYPLATDDFVAVDDATDQIMDALMLMDDVIDADLGVSMTEALVEISFVLDTLDALEATERGAAILATAFRAASQTMPETRIWLHKALVLTAETVAA